MWPHFLHSPWEQYAGWRLNHVSKSLVTLQYNRKKFIIQLLQPKSQSSGKILAAVNDTNYLDIKQFYKTDDHLWISLNNARKLHATGFMDEKNIFISYLGLDYNIQIPDYTTEINNDKNSGKLLAPMPGIITKILVEKNETVIANQPLIILEAMKMEHTIKASIGGKVNTILFSLGKTVQAGDLLITIEQNKNHDRK